MKKTFLVLVVLCGLAACAEQTKQAPVEGRLSINPINYQDILEAKTEKSQRLESIYLEPSVSGKNWHMSYANETNNRPHMYMKHQPKFQDEISVSSKVDFEKMSLATPIVSNGMIYVLDVDFNLKLIDLKLRSVVREMDLSEGVVGQVKSVGMALDNKGILYAVSGNGMVVAVSIENNQIIWRKQLDDSLRSAPVLYRGKLFVSSIKNNLYVLNMKDGSDIWQHKGKPSTTNFLGMGSPAVFDSIVVMPTTNGYLHAFDVNTGVMIWTDTLWHSKKHNLFLDLPHIAASPVIKDRIVYVVGNAGKVGGYQLSNGNPVLDVKLGGQETPIVSGNSMFIVSNQNDLVAFNRKTGNVFWKQKLVSYEDEKTVWYAPVLVNQQIVVVSASGDVIFFDALSGREISRENREPFLTAPVFSDDYMILMTQKGDILLYQ